MIQTVPELKPPSVEERLARGAELLFDMERRGDVGPDYDRYLRYFMTLLDEYEERNAA